MRKTETWVVYISQSESGTDIARECHKMDSRPGIVPYTDWGTDGYEYYVEFMAVEDQGQDAEYWAEHHIIELEGKFDVLNSEFVTSGSVSF